MRKFTCLAATVFVFSMSVTALAGSEIPDLKGTWVYKAQAIKHQKGTEPNPDAHGPAKSVPQEVDFILTIDKQEGFRFSGTRGSAKHKESFVGVIGFDNKTVYLVDEDGMSFCRLVSPDKMEYVYLHITKQDSVASRGIMTRKR